jgi:sirohydrochlorin cobaltochelatase
MSKTVALVIAGHGSTKNPDSCLPTLAHAETIRQRGIFAEVATCFWKQAPFFHEALGTVKSSEIYVVPNFISEGYFTRTVIPREMGLTGPVTVRDGRTIKYCEPAGKHPRMTELLLGEARSVALDVDSSETGLLIVGHGTGLDSNSAEAARFQAGAIEKLRVYAEVSAAFMEEPPFITEWDKLTTQPNVVVVPFFISDGLHSYQDIPVLLGIRSEEGMPSSQSDIFRRNPHDLRGRRLYYGAAIGTEPGFAEILLDQVRAFQASPMAS